MTELVLDKRRLAWADVTGRRPVGVERLGERGGFELIALTALFAGSERLWGLAPRRRSLA